MERTNVIVKASAVALLCALTIGIIGTALALRQNTKTVPNSASIKGVNVGIYWDSACTNQTSAVNWGILEPGANKTVKVYIRNEGNTPVTLSKTVQNWNPSTTSSYITLNWNYTSQTMAVNQVIQVNLTLTVSSTITGIANFTFNVLITSTG